MDSTFFTMIISEFQALGPADGLTILMLAALEGILSVDNALVLAILVRELPKKQQKRALSYGIIGAFVFRFIALIFAAYLMKLMAFKLIGGGYLIYLAMKHMYFFYKEDAHQASPKAAKSFWMTVFVVELTDIAFSIDSITTAVAMSKNLVVVWLGGILGIIALRFAAGFFIKLLERLPKLEDLAYQLIFFVGIKLMMEAFHVEIEHGIFWMMMGVIMVLGGSLVYRDYHQRKSHTMHQDRLLEDFESGEKDVDALLTMENIPRRIMDYLRAEGYVVVAEDKARVRDGEKGQQQS
ncbi:MAG: TerC family protein [Nitrospirae bacterium]|nr:TerC family protein [Nitrospirota bacterium]